jgi:hypothetical protein
MDDDDWQEEPMQDSADDAEAIPVQLVCYYDSTRELRGVIDECWQELQAGFADPEAPAQLRALDFVARNTGLCVDIDTGGEINVRFFPVVAGEPREDLSSSAQVLLQMHDDGRGSVDPAQLRTLVEWLLEDILPYAGHCDMNAIEERIAAGTRPLILVDTAGQLLELPADLAGDDWC